MHSTCSLQIPELAQPSGRGSRSGFGSGHTGCPGWRFTCSKAVCELSSSPEPLGYHAAVIDQVRSGSRYVFDLGDGRERPDPASRSQPDGVHGPSEVIDTSFAWTDGRFRCPDLASFVLYELHVGTFTAPGTFDAAIASLARLRDLGVTAIELMPLASFPGERNWGYDGTYPFAVQSSYGGAAGLQRFVNACHAHDLAVVLDVVFNHLGPEGNYLRDFGPYFTDQYRTPWGQALNFDGPGSDQVRAFFLASAVHVADRVPHRRSAA